MAKQDSKEEILDRVEKRAIEYHKRGHGCAQTGFLAVAEEFTPEDAKPVFKSASFMSAGIARTGNACGALTGAMLAVGLAAGRETLDEPTYGKVMDKNTGKPRIAELAQELFYRFVQQEGSWICRDIQTKLVGRPFDMHDPEQAKQFRETGDPDKAAKLVGRSARLAAEIILQMKEEGLIK